MQLPWDSYLARPAPVAQPTREARKQDGMADTRGGGALECNGMQGKKLCAAALRRVGKPAHVLYTSIILSLPFAPTVAALACQRRWRGRWGKRDCCCGVAGTCTSSSSSGTLLGVLTHFFLTLLPSALRSRSVAFKISSWSFETSFGNFRSRERSSVGLPVGTSLTPSLQLLNVS